MKRIVSLLLALVMMLSIVPVASAAITTLPTSIDGFTSLPAKPTAPEFTFTTVDNHYQVTMTAPDDYINNGYIELEVRDDNWNWEYTYFTWDETKKAFVSDEEVFTTPIAEQTIHFGNWEKDFSVNVSPDTKEVVFAYVANSDSFQHIYWYEDVTQIETDINGNFGWISYDAVTGKLDSYQYTDDEGYQIAYDAYGRLTDVYVDFEDADGEFHWLKWNTRANTWMEYESETDDWSATKLDVPAFDTTEHPALVTLPYAIETPPTTFDPNGAGFEVEDWGNYYYGENLSVSYNDNGTISSYTITTFEDYEITYDRYGRVQFVTTYDSDWNYLEWNETSNQWEIYDWETETYSPVTGIDPFVAANFPAPYAEQYTVTLPPATLAALKVDTSKFVPDELGEMKLGEDGIVSLGDVEYFNTNISYFDADGAYNYIPMSYDEASKTWVADEPLPTGVTLADVNVTLIDEDWKYTSYRNGELDSISINNVTKDADGTYIRYDQDNEYNVTSYYDAAGNMTSYFYNDFDLTMGVEYDMNGTLLYAWADAADGKTYYFYDESDPLKLDDGTTVSGWYYWDENGKVVTCDEPAGLELAPALIKPKAKEPEVIWYPNNTMCVAGISLKDTYGITDKWYNVVPVDLTKDGTQTFDLVASGMFLIGKANVTVADGNVTVTYGMPWGHGYIKEEVLNWFTSVDQITGEYLDAPTSAYAFGEPVSISEDLGGADVGLLFICNRVTYRQPYYNSGAHLVRWYSNRPDWKAFREQLMTIMPE